QGCVGWNGTHDVYGSVACPGGLSPSIVGGNERIGNRQTQTLTIGQSGVRSGATLRVILNISEPFGTLVTLENLALTIYSPTGTVLFSSGNLIGAGVPPGGGVILDSSFQSQGSPGFVFQLDGIQSQLADQFISCSTCATNRIGLAAIMTGVHGGVE